MSSRLTVVLVSLLLATPALIFWLWLVILKATIVIQCPDECRCYWGGYFVRCSNLSLTNIPLNLPTDLRELVLDNNSITSLDKDSFMSRGLTELEQLSVSNCGLETIELGAFNGLAKLTHLTMFSNKISEIIPCTFEKMSRLEYLDLAYNRLEHLEVDVFSGLITLRHIDLQLNKLQYLHPDTFIGLQKLEYLIVAHNPDLQVPTDSHFINSHSLSRLDISHCNVNSVSVETFANVSALEWLNFSYNNLSSVDINLLKVLPKLSKLYLYDNPLQCDCQLQEVWRWCQDHNIETAYEETAPLCDTPSEVQGIYWGVLEIGQCLQDNVYYYVHISYIYTPSKKTDTNAYRFLNVFETVYAFLLIFGTIGNVIILIIIICNKDMRTVPNMYILNLVISDMIYLTFQLVVLFAMIIAGTDILGEIKNKFSQFCGRLSFGLSAYSLAMLSIQRYRVTVNPFTVRVSSQQTWRVTVATICGVWIVAALFAIPSTPIFRTDLYSDQMGSLAYTKKVVLFELLVYCVLPLCVIAFSYIMTARHLVKSAQPISEETKIPQLNTRKNTAAIVLGLTVVFLISYVPNFVLLTYDFFNIFSVSSDELIYTLFVSTCLFLLNSCLNPVALFCTSRAFRRQFKRYLTCCCKANPTARNIELTKRN